MIFFPSPKYVCEDTVTAMKCPANPDNAGIFYGKMYPMKPYKPLSLKGVKTFAIKQRRSKVSLSALSSPYKKGDTLRSFLDKLPRILAVNNLKAVVHAIVAARKNKRPVILGMGAHPIKVGLSPFIIELMQKGFDLKNRAPETRLIFSVTVLAPKEKKKLKKVYEEEE